MNGETDRAGELPDGKAGASPGEEDHVRGLIDQVPQPIFEADGRGGITFANRSAFALFGYDREDLLKGVHSLDLIAPGDRDRAAGNIEKVLGGQARSGTEYTMQRKDGSIFPAMVHSSPAMRDGRVAGMRGVIVDLTKIKGAEERLLLLEKVIDKAPDGIQIVDLEGHVIYSNRAVKEIYGFTPEEFRGRHVNDLNEDPSFAVKVILPALRREGRWEGEVTVKHKDGHTLPILLNTSFVTDSDGTPLAMVGTIKDLTERKKVEEDLRRSEEIYRTVIENTGTAILIVEEDLTISFANQEMERLTGRPREEWVGRQTPIDWISPAQQDLVRGYHVRRRIDPDATPRSYEIDIRDVEGREKKILLTVSVIPGTSRSIASLLDVTERERFVRDLRESEEKFRNLAENSPNMIFINQGGRIVYANRLCEEVLGYTREELCSPDFDFRCLVTPDSMELVREKYETHQAGRDVPTYEYGLVTKSGERIEAINSAKLISYQGGSAILGIVMDITARKKAEEDLARAYGELENQNRQLKKLDALKDTLIRDVSHELKTPVAKHAMQLEILKPLMEEHQLSREERKALVVMEESIRRQESVIRNLLDLSRLEAGGREYRSDPVRLDRLLGEVAEDYAYATEVHGIEVSIDAEEVSIESDAEMLWHLFSNIMNNAIKFRRRGMPGRIRVVVSRRKGAGEIRIEDNGIGMEKEQLVQAFSRFYQATAACEGSGVGLTICRMIVQGLGGRIALESGGRGKGTAVIVTLPLS